MKKKILAVLGALALAGSLSVASPASAAQLGQICVQGSSDAGVYYRNYGSTAAWQTVRVGSCVWIASKKTVAFSGEGVMYNVTAGTRAGQGARIHVGPPVTWIFNVQRP